MLLPGLTPAAAEITGLLGEAFSFVYAGFSALCVVLAIYVKAVWRKELAAFELAKKKQ